MRGGGYSLAEISYSTVEAFISGFFFLVIQPPREGQRPFLLLLLPPGLFLPGASYRRVHTGPFGLYIQHQQCSGGEEMCIDHGPGRHRCTCVYVFAEAGFTCECSSARVACVPVLRYRWKFIKILMARGCGDVAFCLGIWSSEPDDMKFSFLLCLVFTKSC